LSNYTTDSRKQACVPPVQMGSVSGLRAAAPPADR
jgi:hypothetical protein